MPKLGNNSLLRGGKKEEKGEEGGKKKREKKREEKRRKRGKGREREKCRLLFNFPPIQLFLFIRMNLKTLKNSFEEERLRRSPVQVPPVANKILSFWWFYGCI